MKYQSSATAVDPRDIAVSPVGFTVTQNYPNPFNPTTRFAMVLRNEALVSVSVHDVLGREVALLAREVFPSGVHSITWNASGFPSGVYLFRVQSGGDITTGKMILSK